VAGSRVTPVKKKKQKKWGKKFKKKGRPHKERSYPDRQDKKKGGDGPDVAENPRGAAGVLLSRRGQIIRKRRGG